MFGDYHNPNDFWRHHWEPKDDDMSDDDRIAAGILQGVVIFIILMGGLLLCALFGSCTTERVVTVERVRTDTVMQTKVQRDSVWLHDSTFIKVAGDTVLIERWHTKWQNHLEHDTIYKATHDTIPQPYPVVKEVERPMTKTEKGLMLTGIVSIIFIIIFIVSKVKRYLALP